MHLLVSDWGVVMKALGQSKAASYKPQKFLTKVLTDYHSCALLNGIDPGIVERANEIAILSHRKADLVAACAQMTSTEMNELEDAVRLSRIMFVAFAETLQERIARRFLEADFSRPLRGSASGSTRAVSILDDVIGGSDDGSNIDFDENQTDSQTAPYYYASSTRDESTSIV